MNRYVPKPDLEDINSPPSSPLRDLAFMGLGFILILGIGYVVLGFAGEWAFSHLSPEYEQKIFGKLMETMKGVNEAPADLQQVLEKLQTHSGQNFRLFVVEGKDMNAFAVPGGSILVTSELLKEVKTEVGRAFVIAHEIGHFHHRHHLRGLGRALGYTLVTLTLGLGETDVGTSSLIGSIVGRTYNRDQERQADDFAMTLILKTYGHLEGATEFFEAVQKKETSIEKAASFLGTHPLSEERIEALRARQKTQ